MILEILLWILLGIVGLILVIAAAGFISRNDARDIGDGINEYKF